MVDPPAAARLRPASWTVPVWWVMHHASPTKCNEWPGDTGRNNAALVGGRTG